MCPTKKIVMYAGPSSDLYSDNLIPQFSHLLNVLIYLTNIGEMPHKGHFLLNPRLKSSNLFISFHLIFLNPEQESYQFLYHSFLF